jgi:hypothetical protein
MTPASTHVSNAGEAPASRSHLFVQRSCACGSGTSSLSGECDDCRRAKRLGVQAKLTVTAPGDAYEQEADALADRVMGTGESDAIGRAPVQVQRLGGEAAAPGEAAPAIVHDALATPGQPLPDAARAFFETRFGHDFSRTRVHATPPRDPPPQSTPRRTPLATTSSLRAGGTPRTRPPAAGCWRTN